MVLEGVVTNVAAFGAFVDVGVHQDGLVHVSAMSRTFVSDPREVVTSGQVVKVKVMEVDEARKRISLTLRLDDEPGAPPAAGRRGRDPAEPRRGRPERAAGGPRPRPGRRPAADRHRPAERWPTRCKRAGLGRLAPFGRSNPLIARSGSRPAYRRVESRHVITATGLELRAGTRILLADTSLRLHHGDRVGLVGRNGAGKTTTLRVLAGEGTPHGGDRHQDAADRLPPAGPARGRHGRHRQGPGAVRARPGRAGRRSWRRSRSRCPSSPTPASSRRPPSGTAGSRSSSPALGGYAAESEAARICSNLGLPDRVLAQTMNTLSGGQRRRVELARILFGARAEDGSSTGMMLLLDEPTNHLDADSIVWLRDYLKHFSGGVVIISHDVDLLAAVVNKVWFLDAVRGELDVYNMTWQRYLEARSTDEQRRRRERANAEKKAVGADDAGRQARRQGHQGGRGAPDGAARREADGRAGRRPGRRPGRQDPLPAAGRRAGGRR